MARRYGGQFSPASKDADGRVAAPPAPELRPPLRGRARVTILMGLAAVPVLGAFLGGGAAEFATDLLAAGTLIGGAVLTREGLKAEAAWTERRVAKRPAVPRKAFGAAAVGLGVALAALAGLGGVLPAAVYGLVAAGLHLASFGLDPMRDKGMEGVDAFQTERVARTVEEAERTLAQMEDAVRRARDREAETAVARLAATAREMVRRVEDDPRDLVAARKYLGVYLQAARDATVKFADLYASTRDAEARRDFLALVEDLRAGMDAKRETLLLSDRTALDVEIDVLRDRLRHEGVPIRDTTEG